MTATSIMTKTLLCILAVCVSDNVIVVHVYAHLMGRAVLYGPQPSDSGEGGICVEMSLP